MGQVARTHRQGALMTSIRKRFDVGFVIGLALAAAAVEGVGAAQGAPARRAIKSPRAHGRGAV